MSRRKPQHQAISGNSSRRAFVQRLGAGAIGLPGLTLWTGPPGANAALADLSRQVPTAQSIIFLSLYGGPPHQDTFDLKEEAPLEIRGEFHSIATSLNGLRVCEYLPELAKLAHLYTVIRSVTHSDNSHESAFYALMTGWPHPLPNTNARPDSSDYPNYGVVLEQLRPPQHPVPGFMLAGGVTSTGIGQTGGFLGRSRAPYVLPQDANSPLFSVPDFDINADVTGPRLSLRRSLLQNFDEVSRMADLRASHQFSSIQSRAFDLLSSTKLRQAFDLNQESPGRRDAYGRNPFGQNLLVARRLVEAGVPVVQVNWRNKGDGGMDTHYDNFNQCKGTLLPRLDACLSSLLIDLSERGLLDQTLVVAAGEFGRTPKINELAGRDHWAGCNSILLAGGGIRSGFVYGSSDRIGAYPASDPVGPWDVYATLLHCYGINAETIIHDATGRPHPICKGNPIYAVLDKGTGTETKADPEMQAKPLRLTPNHFVGAAADVRVLSGSQNRTASIDGSTLIYIPGGEFIMGSSQYSIEKPPHAVRIDPFWLARTPVTTAMYRNFVAATGHREQEFYNQHLVDSALFYTDDQPAVGVSYDDAVAYCEWAGGRLPTEAEWEFAARGTDAREYPWGNAPPLPGQAVYGRVIGHGGKPDPVGTTPGDCSPFGILDMAGNVLEWCADWFGPYVANGSTPQFNPPGVAQGAYRVLRGGCWSYEARSLRATERLQQPPTQRLCLIGFRMAMDVDVPVES
jgi:formylglycine-generating enzyme required for sulfatase activity